MRINQQSSLPAVQGSLENVNSNQNANSRIPAVQKDSFEYANLAISGDDSLGEAMKEEIRAKQEELKSKFREQDEKQQQVMEALTDALRLISQMRNSNIKV